MRWRPAPRRPFEIAGGGGVAITTDAQRSIRVTDLPGAPVPRPSTEPDQVDRSVQFAVNGGVAAPLPLARRVELGPAFTLRWVPRSSSGLGWYAGVGALAYEAGFSVRWTFD